jgi:hypothetical protein
MFCLVMHRRLDICEAGCTVYNDQSRESDSNRDLCCASLIIGFILGLPSPWCICKLPLLCHRAMHIYILACYAGRE